LKQGFVADAQRVRGVCGISFVLGRPVFGERGGGRHVLDPAHAVDLGQQARVLVQVRHRIDLCAKFPPACQRSARRLRQAVRAEFAVDEIELVFDGHYRGQAEGEQALEFQFQQRARIAEETRAVVIEHAQLQLRHVGLPGNRHQSARDGHAGTVGIAIRESKSRGLHRSAFHVECEHRAGQGHAACEHPGDIRAVDALAALHGVQIVDERFEESHPGWAAKKRSSSSSTARVIRSRVFIIFDALSAPGRGSICPRPEGRQTT
jgi:hypothetical protein